MARLDGIIPSSMFKISDHPLSCIDPVLNHHDTYFGIFVDSMKMLFFWGAGICFPCLNPQRMGKKGDVFSLTPAIQGDSFQFSQVVSHLQPESWTNPINALLSRVIKL